MNYCIIDTKDGRQEKVVLGDILCVNRLDHDSDSIDFQTVLAVQDGKLITDAKKLNDIKVLGTFLSDEKGPKITIQKFKNKVRSKIKKGHRQSLTKVQITQIGTSIWEGK